MGCCLLFATNSFQIFAGCSLVILFENILHILEFLMLIEKVAKGFLMVTGIKRHIYL